MATIQNVITPYLAIEALGEVTDFAKFNVTTLDCTDLLTIFIAVELGKKKQSKFWNFLKVQPKDFDVFMSYWPVDYKRLMLPHLQYLETATTDVLKYRYQQFLEVGGGDIRPKIRMEEFKHAHHVVQDAV